MRVRHNGDVARLELGPEKFALVVEGLRDEVVWRVKAAGYTCVAVDLQGYRTGAMNEALKGAPQGLPEEAPTPIHAGSSTHCSPLPKRDRSRSTMVPASTAQRAWPSVRRKITSGAIERANDAQSASRLGAVITAATR